MRREQVRDASRLVGSVLAAGTASIGQTHDDIAGRAFAPFGAAASPVRRVHDLIARLSYRSVGTGLDVGARAVGAAFATRADGHDLDVAPRARAGLAFLNGAFGDAVERRAPSLAIDMTVRRGGRAVPVERDALAGAFPQARSRLVVLLHGLVLGEDSWQFRSSRHYGDRSTSYATLLERDLPVTAVLLRYNSGLHISDNGRRLSDLLTALVASWPVPVHDLVLIGHSMGGLVARSALHHAAGGTAEAAAWTTLVRDTITLGSPHLGAPLERGVHRLGHALARLPQTRPLADALRTRSAGIKDLRRGTLVELDWSGHDLDGRVVGTHTHVPLHDGARHFVIVATVTRDPASRAARLLGDLMVSASSASGQARIEGLQLPHDDVHRIGGLHHLDLLNHPSVYEQLRHWLASRVDRRDGDVGM